MIPITPIITTRQHAFIKAIADRHDTISRLVQHFPTAENNARRITRALRDAGLITFAHLSGTNSTNRFSLTAPLEDLDFKVAHSTTHKTYTPPTEEELRYIAKISDEDKLIGQRRIAAHQKKYPDRPAKSTKALVKKARNLRYCR